MKQKLKNPFIALIIKIVFEYCIGYKRYHITVGIRVSRVARRCLRRKNATFNTTIRNITT